MKKIFKINLLVFLILTFFIIFSSLTVAEEITLKVVDGFAARQNRTLSELDWNKYLNLLDGGTDVPVDQGRIITANKWIGIYFDKFDKPGYGIDSVIIRFRCGYGPPSELSTFYVDCSNNRDYSKWSDDIRGNEQGEDVNITSYTLVGGWWYDWDDGLEYDVSHLITTPAELNNMEILFRNGDWAYSNLYIDYVEVKVVYSARFLIIDAQTIDDDEDGQIDAYHIFFSAPVKDSSLDSQANGFDIVGYSNEAFSSTGLPNNPDTPNDADIFISFDESGSADTANKPQLTYSRPPGTLESFFGEFLANVGENDVIEQDKVGPRIVSAQASDDSGGGVGVQAGDTVQFIFSENTNAPLINAANIDTVLALSGGHTWKDGNGCIDSSSWINSSVLLVTLSAGGGAPTIAAGDTITPDGITIGDGNGNYCDNDIVLGGDFGNDTSPPYISSRETQDLNCNGYIDAIHIIFSEEIDTMTVVATDFDVTVVTGETYLAGGPPHDHIYITFEDNVLETDATPYLTYIKGSLTDLNGNPLDSSSNIVCSDKSPPAVLSAVASDGVILVPGVDSDDTVIICFSEGTNRPTIDQVNIDSVFVLNDSHSWRDASGNWNADGDELTISFGAQASSATVCIGDTITVSGNITAITDGLLGNVCIDTSTISGTFEGIDTAYPYVLSRLPQDKENGVKTDIVIQISFNERMNEEKTKGAISIKGVRDKDGREIDEPLSGVVSYDTDDFKLVFIPDSVLNKNFTYQVTITSEATDTIGNPLAEDHFTFSTIIDHTKNNTVVSWSEEIRLFVLPSGLSEDFFFVINSDSQYVGLNNIFQANDKLKTDKDPFSFVLEDTIIEINTFNNTGGILKDNFNLPIAVTLSYSDVAPVDGIVDGTMPPVREETLQMYRLDEKTNLWVRLANSVVDLQSNTVSASSIHTSVFALAGSSYSDLSYAYAFPVPFKPSRGDTEITFVNLSPMATIKIFTLNGNLVRKIEHTNGDTILYWDVTNDHGEKLASGVYLYLIKNEKESKKGKLMIIK